MRDVRWIPIVNEPSEALLLPIRQHVINYPGHGTGANGPVKVQSSRAMARSGRAWLDDQPPPVALPGRNVDNTR